MSDMQIQGVLAQIRALSAQAAGQPSGAGPVQGGEFSSVLKQAVEQVSTQQQAAGRMADAFERGASGVDLAQTMLAMNKAGLAFQGVVQVRNHLLSAYREIMNMPV